MYFLREMASIVVFRSLKLLKHEVIGVTTRENT